MNNIKWASEPIDQVENFGNTIEDRMNQLARRASDLSSVANHIHGILFGHVDIVSKPMNDDMSRSIQSTLSDIEQRVYETHEMLEAISSSLSKQKRLGSIYD